MALALALSTLLIPFVAAEVGYLVYCTGDKL